MVRYGINSTVGAELIMDRYGITQPSGHDEQKTNQKDVLVHIERVGYAKAVVDYGCIYEISLTRRKR